MISLHPLKIMFTNKCQIHVVQLTFLKTTAKFQERHIFEDLQIGHSSLELNDQ